MPNPVVHFEILGPDAAALQQFYADPSGNVVGLVKAQ